MYGGKFKNVFFEGYLLKYKLTFRFMWSRSEKFSVTDKMLVSFIQVFLRMGIMRIIFRILLLQVLLLLKLLLLLMECNKKSIMAKNAICAIKVAISKIIIEIYNNYNKLQYHIAIKMQYNYLLLLLLLLLLKLLLLLHGHSIIYGIALSLHLISIVHHLLMDQIWIMRLRNCRGNSFYIPK